MGREGEESSKMKKKTRRKRKKTDKNLPISKHTNALLVIAGPLLYPLE